MLGIHCGHVRIPIKSLFSSYTVRIRLHYVFLRSRVYLVDVFFLWVCMLRLRRHWMLAQLYHGNICITVVVVVVDVDGNGDGGGGIIQSAYHNPILRPSTLNDAHAQTHTHSHKHTAHRNNAAQTAITWPPHHRQRRHHVVGNMRSIRSLAGKSEAMRRSQRVLRPERAAAAAASTGSAMMKSMAGRRRWRIWIESI